MGGRWATAVLRLLMIWLAVPALCWLTLLLLRWLTPGFRYNQTLPMLIQRHLFPDGDLTALTPLGWLLVAVGLFVSIAAFSDGYETFGGWAGGVCGLLGLAVLLWAFPVALWDNDKDAGRYYSSQTVFHVPDLNRPPGSMTDVLDGARSGDGRACDRVGAHDVRSCVVQGTSIRNVRWEARTSSLAAARTAMNNAASTVQRVDIMEETLTYLWGAQPDTGRWSAVLDGSEIRQPMYGVAEWDGTTNTARVCRFEGTYRMNRAFGGGRKNNLRNLLAERHRRLVYDDTDIWGYCDDGRPVIVIPVKRQIGHGSRTVHTAGGVLVLRGSPTGSPVTSHRAQVRPGELPGPVYPISLVRAQRDATQWSAGREHRQRSSFGFEPSDDDAQEENSGEYLLRGPDRRLYYVTPLTPRDSESEALVAYGVAPADQTAAGRLNRYDVHVLADGDPMVTDVARLRARAVAHISGPSSPYPNFVNSGGELQEFTPLGGESWRVYGVQNGQTAFYIDLSASGRVTPRTVTPGGNAPQPVPPGNKEQEDDCGGPVREMTDRRLADCLGRFADELRRRSGGE